MISHLIAAFKNDEQPSTRNFAVPSTKRAVSWCDMHQEAAPRSRELRAGWHAARASRLAHAFRARHAHLAYARPRMSHAKCVRQAHPARADGHVLRISRATAAASRAGCSMAFPFTSLSLPFLFPSLSHMHLTHHRH